MVNRLKHIRIVPLKGDWTQFPNNHHSLTLDKSPYNFGNPGQTGSPISLSLFFWINYHFQQGNIESSFNERAGADIVWVRRWPKTSNNRKMLRWCVSALCLVCERGAARVTSSDRCVWFAFWVENVYLHARNERMVIVTQISWLWRVSGEARAKGQHNLWPLEWTIEIKWDVDGRVQLDWRALGHLKWVIFNGRERRRKE